MGESDVSVEILIVGLWESKMQSIGTRPGGGQVKWNQSVQYLDSDQGGRRITKRISSQ